MRGVEVLGYYLEDKNGAGGFVNKETTQDLALRGLIVNCRAQIYNNDVVMKGVGCKLSRLPIIDVDTGKIRGVSEHKPVKRKTYEIVARVFDGKRILGYAIKSEDGVPVMKSKREVMELARNRLISNARIQMNNGVPILRGVGCELAKMNTIRARGIK